MKQPDAAADRTRHPLPLLVAYLLALVGLATGIALLVYFIAGISLALALLIVTCCIFTTSVFTWVRLSDESRRAFRARVWAGWRAGMLAVIAYDVSRLVIVNVANLGVNPYEAIPLFGQLLTGAAVPSTTSTIIGIAFHLANGVGFGIAYTVVAGERGPLAGLVWGLVLEAAMLTFYPGWLDIRAIQEFASVSILGHAAYGLTLGWAARRLLARPDRGTPVPGA